MSAAASYWRSRTPRERFVLASVGALGVLLLLLAFIWLPLERSRQALRVEIPRLEAAIASMQAQGEEVKRVRALPASTPATAAPIASVIASGALARNIPGALVVAADDRRVRITTSDAAFGALLEMIASAQSMHGLRVDSARIDALPTPGRVRAELILTSDGPARARS